MLPGHYVGNGVIDLTAHEFRSMYLILKSEETKGIPVTWSGDQITTTIPRTITGLNKVEDYFKEQAAKTKAALEYDDRVKMEKRMKELEERVMVLEGYIQGVRDVRGDNEPETLIHWRAETSSARLRQLGMQSKKWTSGGVTRLFTM
jgi:hypothetical protein